MVANNQPTNPRAFYVTELAGAGGRSTWVTVLSKPDGSNATQLGRVTTNKAMAVARVWTLAQPGDTYTVRPLAGAPSTMAVGAEGAG